MPDPATRKAAEAAAAELLQDILGADYSDTALRVTTDHILSFHRAQSQVSDAAASAAVDRLFEIAASDTGQSARVARFLMAWWNGTDLGHFPIADLFGVDTAIANDIATVITWLGRHPGAVYADAFGRRADMERLIERSGIFSDADA